MDKVKAMKKKSEITEDDQQEDYEKELQDLTDKRCKRHRRCSPQTRKRN